MVNTNQEHGGDRKRGRDDDHFGSILQASPSLLQGSKGTSGLNNTFSTSIMPLDDAGTLLLEGGNEFSIDDIFQFSTLTVPLNVL